MYNYVFIVQDINLGRVSNIRCAGLCWGREQLLADHFYYSCFLGLLASVTDGSWPCVVG